jgi:AMP-binding enzyme C-terminal domain/Phosphopantetheine attachment site
MYRTGDYGYIKKGLLYFEGRRDTQIKIRGNRVDMSEVESNVSELHYVSKAAILVYHAGQVDQALVAFIVTKHAITKTPYEIERDLKSRLTPYMIPQVFVIKEFPYMPNGKIDRQTLLKMYEEIASKSEMELNFKDVSQDKLVLAKQVFGIIGGALSSELRGTISLESNFFELGGNSLNTISTVTQLREQGYFIGLTEFMKARNLKEVLEKITTKKSKEDMKLQFDTSHNIEPLDDHNKDICLNLLAKCFKKKSGMDRFFTGSNGIKEEYYKEIIGEMWNKLVEQGFSFMVKNKNGDLIGVSLNLDATDEPEIKAVNNLRTILDFVDSLEKPIL